MRADPTLRLVIAGLVAVACGISTAGCGKKVPLLHGVMGGPAEVKLRVTGARDLNTCGSSSASLSFRVIQVTDALPLTGATLLQFWDHERDVLGASFVSVSETRYVDPGVSVDLVVKLVPAAHAVIVVGDFCREAGSCWYLVQPRKGEDGIKLDVTADASCLRGFGK